MYEEEIHAIWVDPSRFDPVRHGPPFLPTGATMRLASQKNANIQDALQSMAAENAAGPLGYLSAMLAYLRAASLIHQAHHWQTQGQSFYGDHLLFMRIYEESAKGIDSLAERAIGLGGTQLVDPIMQAKHVALCVDKCYGVRTDSDPEGMITISLRMENYLLEALKVVLAVLGQEGLLTDGTENLLQDLADKHEEFVYLLKQRSNVSYSYGR